MNNLLQFGFLNDEQQCIMCVNLFFIKPYQLFTVIFCVFNQIQIPLAALDVPSVSDIVIDKWFGYEQKRTLTLIP